MNLIFSADPVIHQIRENGFQAIVVGGAVRDMLLGQPAHDLDVLTNARPDQILSMFSSQNPKLVGKHFPVCLVNGIEIASCRASSDPWFLADLGMRDFTINAMGFDPAAAQLIDPFGGQKDMKERKIRFVQDACTRIEEDPVRMIRACRFAALLRGTIVPESYGAVAEHTYHITDQIPGERIRLELLKAMSLETPSVFFRFMLETGLLDHVLPCLSRCRDLEGGPHHGETVFEHCMLSGDALPSSRPLLRLAGYLHDAGKFDARQVQNGIITFYDHEKKTSSIEKDLQRLKFSTQEQKKILSLIRLHMRPLTAQTTPRAVRRLLAALKFYDVDYRDFMRMRIADKKGNLAKKPYKLSEIRARLQKLHTELGTANGLEIKDLAVSGHEIADIMELGPGPEIGRVKNLLFEKILQAPEMNSQTALIQYLKQIKQNEKIQP